MGSYTDICSEGVSVDCVDLGVLVPLYVANIPLDPNGGSYQVGINSANNKISILAPEAELRDIVINEIMAVATFAKGYTGSGRDITYSHRRILSDNRRISRNDHFWRSPRDSRESPQCRR